MLFSLVFLIKHPRLPFAPWHGFFKCLDSNRTTPSSCAKLPLQTVPPHCPAARTLVFERVTVNAAALETNGMAGAREEIICQLHGINILRCQDNGTL